MRSLNIPNFVFFLACLLLCAFSADARAADKVLHFNIEEALDFGLSSGKLDGSVKFYFAGQQTPPVASLMEEGITNRKTNAFGKSDAEGCKWVMLSALIALQESAKTRGANAVINIVSYYNRIEYKSDSQYECHVGFAMSGVALKGNYAQLKID